MVVSVSFYFQVHQPFRMRKYTIFDIGNAMNYFDEPHNLRLSNEVTMKKVAAKCYLPANAVMQELLEKHEGFKIAYSFSGTVLEQMEQYAPKVLESFQALVNTGKVEVLAETYYHSLASLYSRKEFAEQVALHTKKIQDLFHVTPKVFRNTELIYQNEIAKNVHDMGFSAMLAEGWDHYLQWRSPNFVYHAKDLPNMKLLLKNYKLSDDVAFSFSEKSWVEWPLTSEKFSRWVGAVNGNGQVVNLFMDYETFGEHQWQDSGIFDFLRAMPGEILKYPDNNFKTPSEVAHAYPAVDGFDVPHPMSWADMTRDVTAWNGNLMQQECLKKIYAIENIIKNLNDKSLVEVWRKLQTSDHFYYMCTKWFADGDVHAYFNPYESPYEAYMVFMNVLKDLVQRVEAAKVVALER